MALCTYSYHSVHSFQPDHLHSYVYCSLFQVKLESNFASIVFAIMVLEGLGRSLDPKLDILEAAKPFLLQGGGFL